jgi:GNAT superfamily N-acetyltransferase
MIRLATSADVPRICELGSQSLIDGPYASVIVDNPKKTYELALQLIHGGGNILLWEEHSNDGAAARITGVFGMLIVAHPFSGTVTADELMWFVEKDYRKGGAGIQLLWEAERIARELGCRDFQVSAPDDKIGAIYERFGFRKMEVKYLKELK